MEQTAKPLPQYRNNVFTPWTPEHVDMLKEAWIGGKSASVIAREFSEAWGIPMTRNAIIGKIDRLGLPTRVLKMGDRRPRREKETRQRRAPKEIAYVEPPENIPFEQRKTIWELKKCHCRWPFGDPKSPDFFYCGGVAVEKSPYCAPHLYLGVNHEA